MSSVFYNDSVLMPADITCWVNDHLEVFPNKNQSASKLTQGRVEEICLIRNPQTQLALTQRKCSELFTYRHIRSKENQHQP